MACAAALHRPLPPGLPDGQGGRGRPEQAPGPYQKDGVVHLVANGRALLADDMGLGETVQAIADCLEELSLSKER